MDGWGGARRTRQSGSIVSTVDDCEGWFDGNRKVKESKWMNDMKEIQQSGAEMKMIFDS